MKSKTPLLTEKQKAVILGDEIPLAIAMLGQYPPRQSINLWDMLRVSFVIVYPHWANIENVARFYEAAAYTPALKNASLTPEQHRLLREMVIGFRTVCRECDLPGTLRQVDQFQETIDHHGTDAVSINNLLQNLISTIKTEMSERVFTRIPYLKMRFFERDDLLGTKAGSSFPEAADDIKAAGNCIAADLNNAAVFHLMCVVNFGLIRIGRRLRVWIKRTPLEFAEWQKMIEKIERKLKQKSIGAGKNKREQDKVRTFCNKMLVKINAFKDIRNTICHARGDYRSQQALAILEDVKEFMEQLAEKFP